MQMTETRIELLKTEREKYFTEMESFLKKAIRKLRSFAHDEDCGDDPNSCPAICCGDQLRILSAVVWDMADTIEQLRYSLSVFMETSFPERRLGALSKFSWQLRTLNSVSFFVQRANNHENNFYATSFWFWEDLVELRDELYNVRWSHDRLLSEYGFNNV